MEALMYSLIVLLLLLLLLPRGSVAQMAPPLIVLGDSTIDTGNSNYINTTLDFRADFPPYGQQFFGKPTGRFSNGRVFVDYICDSLGIPHTSPYLQPDADHSKGVNFGSGGAGVHPETNEGLVISLGTQLKYFTKFQEAQYEKWGSHQAKKYFSEAIYLISIANNDYMSGYFSVAKLREQYSPQDFVALIVSEIVKACEFLHSKGARKLVVLEVGPLGCVPALRQFHPTQGCFQPASDLAVAHNYGLHLALAEWQANHSDLTLLVAAIHQFMMERLSNPTPFDFTEGKAACCGSGPLRGGGPCGRPNAVTEEEHENCDNPNDHVFYDFYHCSEKMHEQFAKALWDGPPLVISPFNLRQLVELSPGCDADEPLLSYGGDPANPFDAAIDRSSF